MAVDAGVGQRFVAHEERCPVGRAVRRFFEVMAGDAGHTAVGPFETERGPVVVETLRFPRLKTVAFATGRGRRAELTDMGIAVAARAGRGGGGEEDATPVEVASSETAAKENDKNVAPAPAKIVSSTAPVEEAAAALPDTKPPVQTPMSAN